MLQLHPMTAKKPRIVLRIGSNRLATVINVPTDEGSLNSKVSQSPTPISLSPSRDMAATPAELLKGKAEQKPSSRLQSRKMAPQRQYKSKKSLRNHQIHHGTATQQESIFADAKIVHLQVVTPPETATNSGTELRQANKHEETAIPTRKRTRNETLNSILSADLDERPTKAPRKSPRKVTPARDGTANTQEVSTEQPSENKRALRSQDPRKISELALLFQEEASPAYVGRLEPISIVEDEPNAIPRVVKKPGECESYEGLPSGAHHSTLQPPPTPVTPIPTARSAPITTFDFSQFERKAARFMNDPLKDDHYIAPHKKHFLREKRWRNVENERSQQLYNKLRNELERLKGPDWLKVLGCNRPNEQAIARKEHLIISIEKELAKQRRFTEELKKQKRAKAERITTSPERGLKSLERGRSGSMVGDDGKDEVDANRSLKSRKSQSHSHIKSEEKPFTSFFSKPHLRNAATKNWRKSARNAMAFGQQLPPMVQSDFELPPTWIDEVIKSRAS